MDGGVFSQRLYSATDGLQKQIRKPGCLLLSQMLKHGSKYKIMSFFSLVFLFQKVIIYESVLCRYTFTIIKKVN